MRGLSHCQGSNRVPFCHLQGGQLNDIQFLVVVLTQASFETWLPVSHLRKGSWAVGYVFGPKGHIAVFTKKPIVSLIVMFFTNLN